MTIRVVLAEDHALFREGVHQLIDREGDLEVIGTATDEAELRAHVFWRRSPADGPLAEL